MTVISPYFASHRAYQDYTHKWPPVCENSFLYFNKGWRDVNRLDHYDATCDFDFTYGYVMAQDWAQRSQEARDFAVRQYWNVVADLQVVLTKKEPQK